MANPVDPTLLPAQRLSHALSMLANGLTHLSESDYPYHAFSAKLEKDTEISPDTLKMALGIGKRYHIDLFDNIEGFFSRYLDPESGYSLEYRTQYELLYRAMKGTLTDIRYAYVRAENVVKVRFFLFGRVPNGHLSGLRSFSIET
jgi:hypothetical protein